MTLPRFEETGSDSGVAGRLVIEGCPVTLVSDASLAAALPTEADGRVRVNGLVLDGVQFEEQAVLSEGKIESNGTSLEILDSHPDDAATRAFAMTSDGVRYLTADIDTTATTIDLDSTAGITNASVIHIGTEAILVGTVASSTQLTGCTRAYWDTTAQSHYAGDEDTYGPQEVHIGRPPTLGGRRAFLYLYGAGDSLAGTGTLRARMIVTLDPSLGDDDATWTMQLDPLTALFSANLGADLGPPAVPRGIYLPDAQPLWILIGSGTVGLSDVTRSIAFSGFWETQEDFIDELNAWFAAEIDGTMDIESVRAVARETGEWDIEFTTDAVTPNDGYFFHAQSPADGLLQVWTTGDGSETIGLGGEVRYPGTGTFRIVRTADSLAGAGQVPRGVLGRPAAAGYETRLPDEARANLSGADHRVMYLGGSPVPALVTGAEIQWSDGDTTQHDFTDFSATDRYVALSPAPFKVFTPASLPEIKLKRHYASGGLQDFRDALVNNSPLYANLGAMPFIHAGDLASWSEATDAERDIPFAANRRFVAYEAVKLEDMLEHEFRLRALCPRFNVDGQIGLVRLALPSQTAVPDHTITEADIPWEDDSPTWQRHSEGWVNTCIYKLGYNASTEEHEGRTYHVRNVQGHANRKQSRELEIAPISEPRTHEDIAALTYDQLVRLAQPVLSILGAGYYTIDVPVIWKHFGALVGDVVSLTCSTIPNVATGTRGVTDLRCLVVGRTWELGSGRGTLRLLASMQRIYGYAPSLTITNQTDLGGNRWELQLSFNEPTNAITMWDGTGFIGSHFALGDRVRAIAWDDDSSPSKQVGDIDVIDEGTVTMEVVFDGVWTPGTLNVLELQSADAVTSASRLGDYAVLAEDDGTISWSGGDERGGGYAP